MTAPNKPQPIPAKMHSNQYAPLADFMPSPPATEGAIAQAGKTDPSLTTKPDMAAIISAISEVFDPEIPVNIYELGLIYDIETGAMGKAGNVAIIMSLTTPNCPVAGILPQQVADKVASVTGVGEVTVRLTWDPPWSKDRMSDDARLALDMF